MIIANFHPVRGGAELQALTLARALVEKGVSVSVLTRQAFGRPSLEMLHGIAVHRRIRVLDRGKLFGLSYLLSTFGFLWANRRNYDILHCHLAHGLHTSAALLLKRLCDWKVIVKIGGTGPLSDFRQLREMTGGRFFTRQLRRCDAVVAVCRQAAAEALAAGVPPAGIHQIPNGVDTARFCPPETPAPGRLITFVGRLDSLKGVAVLIRAFKDLIGQGCDARLQIIGEGPDRAGLERMASRLGVSDRVVFAGEIENVAAALQQSRAFVLPSLSEGLSNGVLEAMACRLPVVATTAGGTADLIADGANGLLVAPESPQQLSDALFKIMQDDHQAHRLGLEARKTAVEHYSIESVADRYLSLYTKLTGNK